MASKPKITQKRVGPRKHAEMPLSATDVSEQESSDPQEKLGGRQVEPIPRPRMDAELSGHDSPNGALSRHSQDPIDIPVRQVEMEDAGEATLTSFLPDSTSPGMPTTETPTLPNTTASIDDTHGQPQPPSREKRYTNRELARLALVAANGNHMTAHEVVLWLSRTFPHLPAGGSWEGCVRSVLLNFPEFHGIKKAGAHGKKKVYGFVNPEFRAQYTTEYSEYSVASHTSASLPTDMVTQSATIEEPVTKRSGVHLPQFGRARKSAPSQPMSASSLRRSGAPDAIKHPQSRDIAKQAERTDKSFNPFERSNPRQPLRILATLGTEKFYSYHETLTRPLLPSIETMTEAEKANKIAEIKARPSRKKYFGSDYRLAHKRRHGLDDIHDERDGRWKACATEENRPVTDQDIDMSEDENQTLRTIFDLPDNMIPMNDGYTELAFRDGTKVSGVTENVSR